MGSVDAVGRRTQGSIRQRQRARATVKMPSDIQEKNKSGRKLHKGFSQEIKAIEIFAFSIEFRNEKL